MTAEVLDAEVRELPPERALVPAQPGQAIVMADGGPKDMVRVATALADALQDIVERKKLYAEIRNRRTGQMRKYPTVEAWMTIARMDNVVGREVAAEKLPEGGWEATVELLRLSDGLVIGRASALCGTKGDTDWESRADHHKRSMAVTRAMSRAFRQQYSWIMALAGYEPTPAEEMPRDGGEAPSQSDAHDGLIGTVVKQAKLTTDYSVRFDSENVAHLGFRLASGAGAGVICEVLGPLAEALASLESDVVGQRVQVWGEFVQYEPPTVQRAYRAFRVSRIQTPTVTIPAAEGAPGEPQAPSEPEAGTQPAEDAPTGEDPAGTAVTEPVAEAAAVSSVGSPQTPEPVICDSQSPYGDDESCELQEGHKGPHKVLSKPFPETWTDR